MTSFTGVGISHIIARNSGDAHLIRLVATNWLINHWAKIAFSVSGKAFGDLGTSDLLGKA